MTPRALFPRGGQPRRHAAQAGPDRSASRRRGTESSETAAPDERGGRPAGGGSAFVRAPSARAGARPFAPVRPRDVDPSRAAAVEQAVAGWRAALVRLGGASTLADIDLLGDAVIDLTAAHPSGIAQLYAGRTTRLSNLVREGSAQITARRSARTVRGRADELAQRYGVAPTYLAIGVATWTVLPEVETSTEDAPVTLEVSADPGTAHADHSATARDTAGIAEAADKVEDADELEANAWAAAPAEPEDDEAPGKSVAPGDAGTVQPDDAGTVQPDDAGHVGTPGSGDPSGSDARRDDGPRHPMSVRTASSARPAVEQSEYAYARSRTAVATAEREDDLERESQLVADRAPGDQFEATTAVDDRAAVARTALVTHAEGSRQTTVAPVEQDEQTAPTEHAMPTDQVAPTMPTDQVAPTEQAVPEAIARTDDAPADAKQAQPQPQVTVPSPQATVRTIHAPVLLRAVSLEPHPGSTDFDLRLESAIEVNPVLLKALRAAGVKADVSAIARSAYTEHGFTPRLALAKLGELGLENIPGFELTERIVVGPFVHPGQALVDDLDAMRPYLPASPVVAALAGDETARAELDVELPPTVPVDRDPATERGAGDLDVDQAHAVDAVASGVSVFLDAPPGADVPGTVAAILADAAASGRTALYVPGSRRTGRALLERMAELGLSDLVLDLTTGPGWRAAAAQSLRAGMDPELVEVDDDANAAMRAELVDVRSRLAKYVAGLHARHEAWNASAYDALQALAELTAARPGPRTTVRLDAGTLGDLAGGGLEEVREELARASALGAFTLRPSDTPWYGARLADAPSASDALERTQRLGELTLPRVAEQVDRVVSETGLERATTLAEWEEQLGMLDGVADALDVFLPQIFERSAADMVIATASNAWRKERGLAMAASVRRRLRKQAKDLLRPGRPVEDLHAELVRVQEQREIWRRHDPAGGWPRLPDGLAQIKATYAEVRADVEVLQGVVGSRAGRDDLFHVPIGELTVRMRELGLDAPALRLLPERTALLGSLRGRGLGALVDDLSERRVPTAMVGPELDLAWWSSVLEQILRTDPALAGYDAPALKELADRFRDLDEQQVASLPGPVRRAVATTVRATLVENRDEAIELYRALGADHGADLRELLAAHPRLTSIVRPVRLVAPMLVAQLLPEGPSVDLLVLDGVQQLPVEQAVGLLARARQVVLVGDSRRGGDGLVDALAPLLPSATLPTDRAERDEGIAAFLARHGYAGVIRSVPAPPSSSRMRLDLVEGFGMPAPGSDAVESVQSEVDHVVDQVIEHALTTPDQSLAVVAISPRHAQRVREAVRAAVSDSPAVAAFFAPDREEPFVVVEIEAAAGLRRDVVILTVGYGKTPHGRVLHRFGPVSGPDGLACLVDALDAVRHRLVIVSCLAPGDIDRNRVTAPGPRLLADLIDQAATGDLPAENPSSAPAQKPDQLLVDLAERLWRLGLIVVPRYGLEGGMRIPLAIGHPELFGELVVAVLTDDEEYVAEQSLRRRDRHWVQRLTARGWRVHMAFSTAVFMDPQAEAEAILADVMAVVEERRAAAEAAKAAVPRPALPHTYDRGGVPRAEGSSSHDGESTGSADDVSSEAGGVASHADGHVAAYGDGNVAADGGGNVAAEGGNGAGDGDGADREPAAPVRRGPVRERGRRPHVVPGLPLAAYSDDQLDDLLAWIVSDGAERDDAELVEELRSELALTRRGAQIDAVLGHVVRRGSS